MIFGDMFVDQSFALGRRFQVHRFAVDIVEQDRIVATSFDIFDGLLTLKGLRLIYERNS